MALDFNIEPFFDDYSENNKFHRILFRPGYAVQARELTQLQTILQEQIKRQGDHLFKNGAMIIPGQSSIDTSTSYVRLKENISASSVVKTFSVLSSVVGKRYRGETSGVEAIVLTATPREVVNNQIESDTLFVKYVSGSGVFLAGEVIVPTDGSSGLDLEIETTDALGSGTTLSIEQGVYYVKNNFVLVTPQTIVLSKYTATPTIKAALKITESIIYPEEDESLLDNALGSPNYAAPGAARYYIDLTLVATPYAESIDEFEYVPVLTINNGVVEFIVTKTAYAEIEKTLARRTFDESGNYVVRPYNVHVKEYRNNYRGDWTNNTTYIIGDIVISDDVAYKCKITHTSSSSGSFDIGANWIADSTPRFNYGLYQGPTYSVDPETDIVPLNAKISIAVEPGKAYVRGYEVENISTSYLTIDKARDVSTYENYTFDSSLGNYILISSVNALPSIDTIVTFYDRYGSAGTTPVAGVIIATARVKQIQLHETGVYKLFLFDLQVASGKDFAREAKYCYSETGTTTATRFTASIKPTLRELVGTLQASSSSTTVNGVNTTFITDLKQYDYITIGTSQTVYQVTAIVNNNSSITIGTAISIVAGSKIYRVSANIVDPASSNAVFALPRFAVQDTRNLNYSFYKKAEAVNSGVTITESGYVFGTTSDTRNYIALDRSTGALQIPTVTGDNTASATFTCTGTGPFDIIYNLRKTTDNSSAKLKQLTEITETGVVLTSGKAVLTKSDAYEIVQILDSASLDVTDRFDFDNGQRPTHYDLASITLIAGQTATGPLTVKYNYFFHLSGGDYYSVNSYTHSTSGLEYEEIQSDLSDAIDFRPRRNNTGTWDTVVIPKFGEETDIEYNYYLGRIDKLSLDSMGNYVITNGIPAAEPEEPNSPQDCIDLYRFYIEPFTFSADSLSIKTEKIENKRYTMRDINNLENRIKNLEYYTSLNMLEQSTLNVKSYDQYGLERPQNGFIVDSFATQNVGDATSLDWKASLDMINRELRPSIIQNHISLYESLNSSLNRTGRKYEVRGDIVTLPIQSTTPLVKQLRASHYESVNPFNVYTFHGKVELNPWSDTWFEVNRRPDVIINDNGKYNAIVAAATAAGAFRTVWNSWQEFWSGWNVVGTSVDNQSRRVGRWWNRSTEIRQVTTETLAQTGYGVLTGTRGIIVEGVEKTLIADKVLSSELIPYMRSRDVLFRGEGFKPKTRLYTFFDGVSVDTHIKPAKRIEIAGYNTSIVPTFKLNENVGSNINAVSRKTSGNVPSAYNYGEVLNEYVSVSGGTPSLTGVTVVLLGQEVSNGKYYGYIDNIKGGALHANSGNNVYFLRGEFTAGDIRWLSTGDNNLTPATLDTTYTGRLFGTFTIPNTPSISFRTGSKKLRFTDAVDNNPINEFTSSEAMFDSKGILETKERTILATKTATIVQQTVTSDRIALAPQFMSRISSDTGWYDPLAQTFMVNVEGGVFLTDVDLFFAEKDESVPVSVEIRNVVNGSPGQYIVPHSTVMKYSSSVAVNTTNGTAVTKFTFNSPVYLQDGVEYALVVKSDSAKYKLWIAQTGKVDVNGHGAIQSQPYAGVLFKSQNSSTWTADQNQDLKFQLNRAVFNIDQTATINIVNQHVDNNIVYDLACINVDTIVLPETVLSASFNNSSIKLGENTMFSTPLTLLSSTNEAGTPSFTTTLTFSSTKSNLSPVIDLGRASAILVSNVIEGATVDNETFDIGGSATAKYVTKKINMNEACSTLKIYFDANVPNNAWIDVYYKVSSGGNSSTDFSTIPYTKATVTKAYTKTQNSTQFTEAQYTVENLSAFDTLKVKLVMKSSNTSQVPRIKDLRVIAYA